MFIIIISECVQQIYAIHLKISLTAHNIDTEENKEREIQINFFYLFQVGKTKQINKN